MNNKSNLSEVHGYFPVSGYRRALARLIVGGTTYQPTHRAEGAPLRPELTARGVRNIRTLATLALGVGLTVSFNGASSVEPRQTPYYDISKECMPKGFQTVETPIDPLEQIDTLYKNVKVKDWLTANQCYDEFYAQVRSQVEPAFAMDVERGFEIPEMLILPRAYVFNAHS